MSKFESFGSMWRVYVRRNPGERLNEECVGLTVKDNGGSLVVLCCFFGRKMAGELIQFKITMKKRTISFEFAKR